MIIKLIMGNGFVDVKKIIKLDCPNKYKGIGNIELIPYGDIWTGSVHLTTSKASFNFGSIKEIQTRSNDDESDEPWKTKWIYVSPFTYKQYYKAAKLLIKLTKKGVK